MKLIVRDSAYDDLRHIQDWIATDRPAVAAAVIERLLSAVELLGLFPRIGRTGRAPDTFEWVVPGLPFIVVYQVDEEAGIVVVVAVFHTARGWPETF
jgi:plasmid stabilization system protein ParE